jgi:putative toxin-antitoxin system antitoxin component (TIGR02293 family)
MTTLTDFTLDVRVMRVLGDKTANKKKPIGATHLRDMVLRGYPFAAFESVLKEIDLQQKQLSEILGMTESTLARRKRDRQAFTTIESDRLYRVARITALAFEVFGDENKARIWMKRSNDVMDGDIPLALLETEIGASQVEDELLRILYGIYI